MGRSRALQLDIAALAITADHLAEQERAAVTQLRDEVSELVPCIGLGDRFGAGEQLLAREDPRTAFALERARVDTERLGQLAIERDEARFLGRSRPGGGVEALHLAREAVVEGDGGGLGVGIGHGGELGFVGLSFWAIPEALAPSQPSPDARIAVATRASARGTVAPRFRDR